MMLSFFSNIWKPSASPVIFPTTNTSQSITKLEKKWVFPVLRVVDGDTIKILMDGKPVTIRILGIDTPETSTTRTGYTECYGKEASEYAKSVLTGQTVRIESDITQDTKDKYGRTLAHVFFSWGLYYQEESIKKGYGFRYIYKKPTKYDNRLKIAEDYAKKNKVGVWKWCNGKRERAGTSK